jgi:hypothetical protein
MWWYSFRQFLAAQANAPPLDAAVGTDTDGVLVVEHRGRRWLGLLFSAAGLPGGLTFLLGAIALIAQMLGAAAEPDSRFQAIVLTGIGFPFFVLLLLGLHELTRRRRVVIDENTVAVRQAGVLVRRAAYVLPRAAIRGVGLYRLPQFAVSPADATFAAGDRHAVDLVFRGQRSAPLVLYVMSREDDATARRAELCRRLDCPALDPPEGPRGRVLRYWLYALALCLLPTALSLIAAAGLSLH